MTGTMKFPLVLALVAGTLLCASLAWADPPSQVGRLSLISGSVSFQPGNLDEWAPATLNYPLSEGDHLWTDAGARAEVQLFSSAIRLNSNTEFSFLNLDDETVQVRVTQGSLNISVRALDEGTAFEIDTPNATVSVLAAGTYRVDVDPTGDTSVIVRSGDAEVTAGEDAYDVPAGQSTVISGTDSIAYYVTDAPGADEWDAWCAGRDRRAAIGASNPYVAHEMIGADDLAENGTWIVADGYGQAWAPSHVPVGWAPYRFGHWAWVEPWGWTWIDDMPWGFAPFHYGRWTYLNARWVWVPGTVVTRPVYAPALVVFVGGAGWSPAAGGGIGWFPLGPREVYVPPYHVSTAYVQRINVAHAGPLSPQVIERYNPNTVVYVNRNAPRGVTVVPRDVFVQSRPAGGAMLAIPQGEIGRAPLMGMTAMVVPQRESVIAQPFAARSPVPQPPPGLMNRRVYSRNAPPPPLVPFAIQQQALRQNPGRPVDPESLSRMRQNPQAAPPPVMIVNPAPLDRPGRQPVIRNGPQPGAPGRQPMVTPAPGGRGPAVAPPGQQRPPMPAPGGRGPVITPPDDDQRLIRPSPGGRPPAVTPAPGGRPTMPGPGGQQRPPGPGGRQPVMAPAPGGRGPAAVPPGQQRPPAPSHGVQAPAQASGGQQHSVAPSPNTKQPSAPAEEEQRAVRGPAVGQQAAPAANVKQPPTPAPDDKRRKIKLPEDQQGQAAPGSND